MIDFTQSEILEYYSARVPGLKTIDKKELRAPCPIHSGKDLNFAINAESGQWYCHSRCSTGGDILDLEQALTGTEFPAAKARVFEIIGRPEPRWDERDIEATYDYQDEAGVLVYQVVRKYGKKFMQRRPDGAGGWQWGIKGLRRFPFHLPKLLKENFVGIVEGEKDVLTLESIGIPGTCNPMGAGKFKPDLAEWFAGKRVAIFPDNDDPGREHALEVAAVLHPVVASLRIVELPGLPAKGDVTDFVKGGGTVQQIRNAYSLAQEWTPEWEFASDVPDPDDKYVRTFRQVIEECGGLDGFWRLEELEGIETPFRKLTRSLGGGMRDGEVYVIGANQGMGKTSLALQFIIAALRKRVGVLMFSMEMRWRDVFQRLVSIEAEVDLLDYREINKMHPQAIQMRDRLREVSAEFVDYPLFVSTKTRVTPEYLISESTRLRKRHKINLIVIDHMQLMGTTGKPKSDYEKFTAISRATKETAQEVGVPVLLVSQTSRDNSHRGADRLRCSDLRGSGAIEEDAAAVMLLYYDSDDKKMHENNGTFGKGPVKAWLSLDKNRFGVSGTDLPLMHRKACTRFDLCMEGANA